jgi:hypothetical protein
MKKSVCFILLCVLLLSPFVFADDVSIDSSGNVETGVSDNADLEVTGASAEDAIVGSASRKGAIIKPKAQQINITGGKDD